MTAVVDTNVLLYATDLDSDFHDRSNRWLTEQLAGSGTVGFSWIALLGFARIATNPRICARQRPAKRSSMSSTDGWANREQ